MVLVVADSVLNQENKLLCCITANQYRCNLFVDGFAQWFRSTLFLLIHLPDQKIHGGFGNQIRHEVPKTKNGPTGPHVKIGAFGGGGRTTL